MDGWLASLFLGELEPHLREAFAAVADPDLETRLDLAYQAGRVAHPDVELDASRFVRHLAAVLDDTTDPPSSAMAALHHADLYLACACAHGESPAIAKLERDVISTLEAPLRSTGLDRHAVDDVRQRVREILLVGSDDVPGIASYRGRGQLRSWMRAVAVRQAMVHFRGKRETPVDDSALEAMPMMIGDDPQLAPWKQQYAAAFREAFARAVAALDDRTRTLLRQHHVDRLSIDELARLHRVHRATAARWVAAARTELFAIVREHMTAQLAIAGNELDSALRLARSQLEISIHRLLGAKPQRKT